MVINGVELEFNLYDAESEQMKKRYFAELEKMKNISEEQSKFENEVEGIKFLCSRIKSLFDNVFGEGTGVKVCTEKNDLLICMDAYEKLIGEQMAQQNQYNAVLRRMRRHKIQK